MLTDGRYAFQTPEAWTEDGGYRSLHYMRPLGIWAMQWALSPPELHKDLRAVGVEEESPGDAALGQEKFEKLARMLKLPEEQQQQPKGYLWAICNLIRQMVFPASQV